MFKAIGSITTCLSETVVDLTKAVKPLTNALCLGTKSIELQAQELYDDTEFECSKNQATRTKLMKEFQAELDELTAK